MFSDFSQSVDKTIGVPYEIIRIDNSQNQYNICEAYNKGKEMCKYELVCFSHEDIAFETNGWGNTLIHTFQNPAIGLVGVLGICYLSLFPIRWLPDSECEGQFILNNTTYIRKRFPVNSTPEVVAVDGMFFCTRKSIIDKLRFSDDILKGFHGYDMDISFQIRQQYKVVVTRNILLTHYSSGNFNQSYYDAMK
ncbi:MAG: hypothetical protein HY305_02555, partial [Sphingobacteriales bacterium]|nr:hypothetical protein [Sphingobacteriales bacterium]